MQTMRIRYVGWSAVAGAILALIAGFASGARAAPLNSPTAAKSPMPASNGKPAIVAPRRAASGASLADRNRNRISEDLEAYLATLQSGRTVDVIVTATSHDALRASRSAAGNITVLHEYTRIPAYVARVTGPQVQVLASAAGIFRVERDVRAAAYLETAKADFGVNGARDALAAAGLSATGARVAVCVVDTGVDGSHEQFVDETTGQSKIVAFKDFVGDVNGIIRTVPYDDVGHGSHVSNIAAGDGTPVDGLLAGRFGGVAPSAELYVAKVLDYSGSGSDSGVMLGVEWCADQIAAAVSAGTVLGGVINLSLGVGTSSDGQDALSQLVNATAEQGIAVVVAAGNIGAVPGMLGSPAAAHGAITVGAAAEWSGNPADIWYSAGVYPAPFSSRGPTADGRIKPDIMGPGTTIVAAYIENILTGPYPCWAPCYAAVSGTSMASPFVAGVVALMIEAGQGALSVNDMRQILYLTAHDRFPSAGKDRETGFGLVDASAAVNAALGNFELSPVAFPADMSGQATVPDYSEVIIPVQVLDPSKALAITLTLDGTDGAQGWKPDLDAQVLDAAGNPLSIPGIPPEWGLVPEGSVSTCPAGTLCGTSGRQETLYVVPPLDASYMIRVYAYEGRPNRGAGGSFRFEISNGTTSIGNPVDEPQGALQANAGPARSLPDDDNDGFVTVQLDGSNSTGPVVAYKWSVDVTGMTIPDGMFTSVILPTGQYTVTLTVLDKFGNTDTHTANVSVGVSSGGGGKGKGGGGKGGGKPNSADFGPSASDS